LCHKRPRGSVALDRWVLMTGMTKTHGWTDRGTLGRPHQQEVHLERGTERGTSQMLGGKRGTETHLDRIGGMHRASRVFALQVQVGNNLSAYQIRQAISAVQGTLPQGLGGLAPRSVGRKFKIGVVGVRVALAGRERRAKLQTKVTAIHRPATIITLKTLKLSVLT